MINFQSKCKVLQRMTYDMQNTVYNTRSTNLSGRSFVSFSFVFFSLYFSATFSTFKQNLRSSIFNRAFLPSTYRPGTAYNPLLQKISLLFSFYAKNYAMNSIPPVFEIFKGFLSFGYIFSISIKSFGNTTLRICRIWRYCACEVEYRTWSHCTFHAT